MSYKNKTYVIFDGDNDRWAYSYMRGWKANDKVDFDFEDAHEVFPMTYRAQDESYVKAKLRLRFNTASQAIVLIGEQTKNLYKYIRWELDVARERDLPIIAVNLNNKRGQDESLCPPIIKDEYVVHISFKLAIIRYALDNFPSFNGARNKNNKGPLYYPRECLPKFRT